MIALIHAIVFGLLIALACWAGFVAAISLVEFMWTRDEETLSHAAWHMLFVYLFIYLLRFT